MSARSTAIGLALAFTATGGCALSGAPRPAASETMTARPDCASAILADVRDDGLVIDLGIPAASARRGVVVNIVRNEEPWRAIELDAELAAAASHAPLPFLDADFATREPRARQVSYRVTADDGCAAPALVVTRSPMPRTQPGPPAVSVIGLGARLDVTNWPGPLKVYRRAVHREDATSIVVEDRWDPSGDETWVDTGLEPGGIYAYSIAPVAVVTNNLDERSLLVERPRSGEAYAVIQPPDRAVAPVR